MAEAVATKQISEEWDFEARKQSVFTGDHVIDAYLQGKKDGLESYQKALLNNLKQNVSECGKHTSQLLTHLKDKNFNDTSAFLKINQWDSFSVLVSIKENDFLNPAFLQVYDYLTELEDNICSDSDTLKVGFSFVDYNEHVNDQNIIADGYVLKFKKA